MRNPQNSAGSVPNIPISANILIQKKEQKPLLLEFVIPTESLKGKIERFSLFCFISISYKCYAHNSLKQRDLICRTFVVLLSPLTSKMSPQKDIV